MGRISISEKFGSSPSGEAEGRRLYTLISEQLNASQRTVLDFSNTDGGESTFLGAAIGDLYGVFPPMIVRDLLSFENMGAWKERVLAEIIQNAMYYYGVKDEE